MLKPVTSIGVHAATSTTIHKATDTTQQQNEEEQHDGVEHLDDLGQSLTSSRAIGNTPRAKSNGFVPHLVFYSLNPRSRSNRETSGSQKHSQAFMDGPLSWQEFTNRPTSSLVQICRNMLLQLPALFAVPRAPFSLNTSIQRTRIKTMRWLALVKRQ